LRKLQTSFNDKLLELEQLRVDVDSAKDTLLNSTALSSLAKRITSLEQTVRASTEAFNTADSLLQLIKSTNDRLDDLIKGNASLELSYNRNLFKEGYGVKLGKSVPNELTISADLQNYSVVNQVDLSSNTNGEKSILLGAGGTQVRHAKLNNSNNPIPYNLTQNLTLYIDDSINTWKTGQTLRLVFDSQVLPGTYTISLKTDANNIKNSTAPYSVNVTTLTIADFPTNFGRTGKPIIDIVCVDAKTLTFAVDKIIR
jgi:predicted acyl esterase